VTILGSGTAVPNAERFPSGVLVQSGGTAFLVDAGPGVLRRLPQAGVGLEQITAVLLTHYHTDHSADVASLLFALRNPRYRGRPTLHLRGAAGLTRWLGLLTQAWPWLEPHDYALDVQEIAPGSFALAGLTVTAVPIRHTAQSLAYRIADPAGRVVAVSGDADECDGLVEVARDADLFVCEAAFPDAHYTPGHLTPSRAARAAAAAKVKTLCLTHFYPECEGHDLLGQARSAFAGPVCLARDLMSFELA
jgi:ribonuclease BN (tRNA processing enzyme)